MLLPRHLRALATAPVLVALLTGAIVEPTMGALRDGTVHHETTAQTVEHNATFSPQGEHGHEDGPAQGDHGPTHQHGTSTDHCTHIHGVGLPAIITLMFAYHLTSIPEFGGPTPTGTAPSHPTPPPRA